jgi:hypothetical protein
MVLRASLLIWNGWVHFCQSFVLGLESPGGYPCFHGNPFPHPTHFFTRRIGWFSNL